MRLRMHYLDEVDDAAFHDYEIPQRDLMRHVDFLAEMIHNNGLISHWNGSDFLFSVPASRVLKLEARP